MTTSNICECGHEKHYISAYMEDGRYPLGKCMTKDCPCKKFKPRKEETDEEIAKNIVNNALRMARMKTPKNHSQERLAKDVKVVAGHPDTQTLSDKPLSEKIANRKKQMIEHIEQFGKGKNRNIDTREKGMLISIILVMEKDVQASFKKILERIENMPIHSDKFKDTLSSTAHEKIIYEVKEIIKAELGEEKR